MSIGSQSNTEYIQVACDYTIYPKSKPRSTDIIEGVIIAMPVRALRVRVFHDNTKSPCQNKRDIIICLIAHVVMW